MIQLYLSLNEAGLMFKGHTALALEEVDYILLETYENGTTHSVDVNTFEMLFGDVGGNPTYEELSGPHTFKLGDKQFTMTLRKWVIKNISTNGKSKDCLNLILDDWAAIIGGFFVVQLKGQFS